jgi:hypothetical protein
LYKWGTVGTPYDVKLADISGTQREYLKDKIGEQDTARTRPAENCAEE